MNKAADVFSQCASVPLKSVFALWSEIVDVGLEMQFEDVVLVDVFRLRGDGDWVTQQRKAGQWIIILRREKKRQNNWRWIQIYFGPSENNSKPRQEQTVKWLTHFFVIVIFIVSSCAVIEYLSDSFVYLNNSLLSICFRLITSR